MDNKLTKHVSYTVPGFRVHIIIQQFYSIVLWALNTTVREVLFCSVCAMNTVYPLVCVRTFPIAFPYRTV